VATNSLLPLHCNALPIYAMHSLFCVAKMPSHIGDGLTLNGLMEVWRTWYNCRRRCVKRTATNRLTNRIGRMVVVVVSCVSVTRPKQRDSFRQMAIAALA
jgi:hypothetical protein